MSLFNGRKFLEDFQRLNATLMIGLLLPMKKW